MSEELRRVRDTLVEELRRSEVLTVAGRALFARYAAMSDAEAGVVPEADPAGVPGPAAPGPGTPGPAASGPAAPARPGRQDPVEEEEDFGGSFMVRSNSPQPNIPGYRETPSEVPRSIRYRRR
jgi:hypothetical protein